MDGCVKPRRARGLCSSHYNRMILAPEKRHPVKLLTCSQCGSSHERTYNRHSTNFCSFSCRSEYRRQCGEWERRPTRCTVPPDHPVALLIAADQEAIRAAAREANQARAEAWPSCRVFIRDCTVCAQTFTTPYTVHTCSDLCAAAKKRADRNEADHRRRARKRDAFVAPVYRFKVYERDGWRCHLCGKPTSREEQVPHPLAPTLDHVIPLAAGGTHEPSNVKTAHFLCNARKGARGSGEQLMLIG